MFSILISVMLFSQVLYNGFITYKGELISCGDLLNKYAHRGIPSITESEKVNLCCRGLREIALQGFVNELLVAHLRICRQLGR